MAGAARYDTIGTGYDAVRAVDPRLTEGFLRRLDLPSGARVLDLACGTGNYTRALSEAGLAITGVDRSMLMLRAARAKAPALPLCLADAGRLPFPGGSFDGAICCLAIHHFDALEAPFAEIGRVVKSGRFVIFTSTPEQTGGYWLKHYFPAMIAAAAAVMPPLEAIEAALAQAGFRVLPYETWDVPPDLCDHFMYSGKHRPHLYLEQKYRGGSSGFRRFATAVEFASGLARLKEDISTGRIESVIRAHLNAIGDYGWVVGEKG